MKNKDTIEPGKLDVESGVNQNSSRRITELDRLLLEYRRNKLGNKNSQLDLDEPEENE